VPRCPAGPFGDDQVGLSVAGDVTAHRNKFRFGVIVVERADDESLRRSRQLLAIEGLFVAEDFEIRVLGVGGGLEVGICDIAPKVADFCSGGPFFDEADRAGGGAAPVLLAVSIAMFWIAFEAWWT
jgi:hypothetical protein